MRPQGRPSGEIVWTIVVAGGSGVRFGTAKQYEMLGDRRVLDWSIATAQSVSDGVVVVVPAHDAQREHAVAGGASRSDSVRAGLAAVPAEATIICVHDACRPFASVHMYEQVIDAVCSGSADTSQLIVAAIPGLPVTDTIKQVDSTGRVTGTPRRDQLVAVQTPQAFRASALRDAHAKAVAAQSHMQAPATDDAMLVEQAGGVVVVVDGSSAARKITEPADLQWARTYLIEQGLS